MIRTANLVTKFAGNATHGKRVMDFAASAAGAKAVLKHKTSPLIGSAMAKAKEVDMSFGGHIGQMYSKASSVSSNSGLFAGLMPGANEFKRVRQNIDSKETLDDMLKYGQRMNLEISNNMNNLNDAVKKGSPTASIYGKDIDVENISQKRYDKMMRSMANQRQSYKNQIKELQDGYLSREQNLLEKAKTYYSNPEYGKKRMAATGVVAGGAMVANRLSSGGSLTRDQYGDRDIVGLPFI